MNTNDEPSRSSLRPVLTATKIEFSIWKILKHHFPRFLLTILIDIVLPLLIYFSLQKYLKPVYALLLAGTPPLLMVIFKGILFRTFDALGFLVFVGFALSGTVAIISRSPIVFLLEKSLVTCVLSVIFTLTLLPFRCWPVRPVAYYLYQDLVPTTRTELGLPESIFQDEQDLAFGQYSKLREHLFLPKLSDKQEVSKVYEWIYTHCLSFRYSCFMLTSIWAVGFFFEFLARLILILLHLSVNKIVLYGHAILSSITVTCIVLSILCVTIERKHTLVYIERWISSQQQRKSVDAEAELTTARSNPNL